MGGDVASAEGRDRTLSVVIPAFNEAASLRWAIGAIREVVASLVADGRLAACEVVVVDDHSTDATAQIVLDEAASGAPGGPTVRLVRSEGARGLGAAIRCGIGASTGDLVLY